MNLPVVRSMADMKIGAFCLLLIITPFYAQPLINPDSSSAYQQRNNGCSSEERQIKNKLDLYRLIYKNKNTPDYANCLADWAFILWENGRFDEAEKIYNETMAMYSSLYQDNDNSDYATCIGLYGRLMDDLARFDEAESLYRKAVRMKRTLSGGHPSKSLANSINDLGVFLSDHNRSTEAEPLLLESYSMYKELYKNQDHELLAGSSLGLAIHFSSRGKYEDADTLYQNSVNMYLRLCNGKVNYPLANALQAYGLFCYQQGRYARADSLLTNSYNILKVVYGSTDSEILVNSLLYKVDLLEAVSRYREASGFCDSALVMARRLYGGKIHQTLANAIMHKAFILDRQGIIAEASFLYDEALEMLRKLPLAQCGSVLAKCLELSGFLLYKQGMDDKAKTRTQESWDIYKAIYNDTPSPELANVIQHMAIILNSQQNYIAAEILFKNSLSIARRVYEKGNKAPLVSFLSNLCYFYSGQKKYLVAASYLTEALEIIAKSENLSTDQTGFITATANLAFIFDKLGRYTQAEELYKEAIKRSNGIFNGQDNRLTAGIKHNLAIFLTEQRRNQEAADILLDVNSIDLKYLYSYFFFLTEKEKETYLQQFISRLEYFNSFGVRNYKSIPAISASMYDNLLAVKSIIPYSLKEARLQLYNTNNKTLAETYNKWITLKKKAGNTFFNSESAPSASSSSADDLEDEIEECEKQLSRSAGFISDSRFHEKISWRQIQSRLDDNEAAIEIVRFNMYNNSTATDTVCYAALILTKQTIDQPDVVCLYNGNDLDSALATRYQQIISARVPQNNSLQEDTILYNAFWKPIADRIAAKKKIYFSGDGIYNQINLEVLRNYASGKTVLEEHDLTLLTSTRDLVSITKPVVTTGNSIVALGNPEYSLTAREEHSHSALAGNNTVIPSDRSFLIGVKLSELPGTEAEVTAITEILNSRGWIIQLYTGAKATEECLKHTKSPRILHIATHGKFVSREEIDRNTEFFGLSLDIGNRAIANPLARSMLFLAGAQNTIDNKESPDASNDGILTAREVSDLELAGTDLVVLSACESGLGESVNGQGIMNLQRSFQIAGARNIIMSLWPVDDQTTKELMICFYENLVKKGNIREAFTNAKNEIRTKYSSPYYWGGFVLIGQ